MCQRQPNTAYSHSAGTPTAKWQEESGRAFPGMLRAAGGRSGSPAWHLQEGQPWQDTQLCSPFSVLDVNDENPTFFPAVYNVSLPEDVARDFKVVRLNCTDADIGLNAELSYFITGVSPMPERRLGLQEGTGCPRPRPGCSALSAALPSPSKPYPASPSAERPLLAPGHADRSGGPAKA